MVIDITEIIMIRKEIESLQELQAGLEEDDIDYIGLQFEINWNYSNIEEIKKEIRSGG
jgi:hypothetical protein